MTPEEVTIVTSTARASGAVGVNAIVPRIVLSLARPNQTILDFGCGPHQLHVRALRQKGLNVTGCDLSLPGSTEAALKDRYDIIYLSNVLNVQPSGDAFMETLAQVRRALKPGGKVVANYPASPRKCGLSAFVLEGLLWQFGWQTERLKGYSCPVWMMTWEVE